MRIILRPGHGLTPPAGPTIDYSAGKRGTRRWLRQRPGNREDDYTAEFCAEHLIPALVRHGHTIRPLRALDPVTGELDTTPTTVGTETLPGLSEDQTTTQPRWLFNASVEGALQGVDLCRSWPGRPWNHDPVSACRWERAIPASVAAGTRGELYLSIHQNWFSKRKMHGCNVLYYGKSRWRFSRAGRRIAGAVYESICNSWRDDPWAKETRLKSWPRRLAYRLRTGSRWECDMSQLWELRTTIRPAVLVELAFASNSDDLAKMHDPAWCSRMAEAIAAGVSKSE